MHGGYWWQWCDILDGLLAVDNARTYQTSADVFYSGVYDGLPTGLTEVVCNAVIAQYTNNNSFFRDPQTDNSLSKIQLSSNNMACYVLIGHFGHFRGHWSLMEYL